MFQRSEMLIAQVKARFELKNSDAQFGQKRGTRSARDGVNSSGGRCFPWAAQERRICFIGGPWRGEAHKSIYHRNLLRSRVSIIDTSLVTVNEIATSTQVIGLPVERDLRTDISMRTELAGD